MTVGVTVHLLTLINVLTAETTDGLVAEHVVEAVPGLVTFLIVAVKDVAVEGAAVVDEGCVPANFLAGAAPTVTPATHIDSIVLKSSPADILKYPWSPQSDPHEFCMIQFHEVPTFSYPTMVIACPPSTES
jgi:hypothetical protein